VLKKSAGDSPDNIKATSTALLELSRIRMSQGHVPEGKAMLEKAVEKDPNAVQALAILMYFDVQAKQPAKAVARAQAAIQRSPTNGILYDELGEVQWSMGDFKAALESSTKAMQLSPNYPDAVKTYTKAEIALGNIDPAISTWQQWIGAHPADSNGFATLGTLEEAKSETKGDPADNAKAMDYYKKALQIDSNNPIAANNLAYMMVDAGQNMDVALTLAQTARRGMPDSPQTADTLAWIYCNKGDYNSARDLLEQALKAYPNDASMQFHLGMTYSKMNDKANALVHLKKSLAIAPKGKLAKEASDELAKLG
jgi:tetratricopeptide (TPR) repeat protein